MTTFSSFRELRGQAETTVFLLDGITRMDFVDVIKQYADINDVPEPYHSWIVDPSSIPEDKRSSVRRPSDYRKPKASKAVEPELVKVYRNAIDQAIDKLNALNTDDEGRIEVPWVQHARPKIETERWADAKLRSFLIEELQATQKYVKRETVQWHIEHLNDSAHDNRAMPNVLVADTEYLIYDGHHRLVALWLLGADTANCWKLEI